MFFLVCVDECYVDVCPCACGQSGARMAGACSLPYSLDRGLSLNLELGWWPANLANLPISSHYSTDRCKAQLLVWLLLIWCF